MTGAAINIDPELRDLIPARSTEERDGLEASIKAEGCRVPLDVWNGILVDGHHRHEICTRLGIPFETRPITFEDRTAARIWIRNNQMGRRNLHEFVRTELALENQAEIAAQAKERQREAGEVHGRGQKVTENLREPIQPRHERETSNVIGKAAGVSGRTVEKVKKIKATGTPERQQAIRENKVSISAAVELATLPAAKQIEVVAKDNVSIRDAAKAVKATRANITPLVVPEFASLLPPLRPAEYEGLEASILRDGCLSPLCVWRGRGILLDGHQRLEICTRHAIPYTTIGVDIDDWDSAIVWILENQLLRANYTEDQILLIETRIKNRAAKRMVAAEQPNTQWQPTDNEREDTWTISKNEG